MSESIAPENWNDEWDSLMDRIKTCVEDFTKEFKHLAKEKEYSLVTKRVNAFKEYMTEMKKACIVFDEDPDVEHIPRVSSLEQKIELSLILSEVLLLEVERAVEKEASK